MPVADVIATIDLNWLMLLPSGKWNSQFKSIVAITSDTGTTVPSATNVSMVQQQLAQHLAALIVVTTSLHGNNISHPNNGNNTTTDHQLITSDW